MALTAVMLAAGDPSELITPAPADSRSKPKWRRIVAAAILAAALSPGLWWRSPAHWDRTRGHGEVRFARLAARTPASWPAGLRLVGAWRLTDADSRFGGYSALLATEDGTLTAIGDSAGTLQMVRPDGRRGPAARFGAVGSAPGRHASRDVEAATGDPRTGVRWFAYEEVNLIRRVAPGDAAGESVRPPAMRDWPENGGPEAMVRLADGRFIVLAEDAPLLSTGAHAGLLFPSDPVAGARPIEFSFRPPIGYDPSDMAALPDGRVAILLRTLDLPFPPFFKTMLTIADPADIAPGREWRWRKLADLDGSVPRENYEGLAISPAADGATLWVISDDNFSRLQRTLLLELNLRLPPPPAAGK